MDTILRLDSTRMTLPFSRAVWCVALLMLSPCAHSQQAPAQFAELVEKEETVEMQKPGTAWKVADKGAKLAIKDKLRTGEFSRAVVRLLDLNLLRVDELSTIEISAPLSPGGKGTLEVKQGGTYFFSREKAQEMQIRTPAVNGALRGTEFALRVAENGRTVLTMFEGEVELSNPQGRVLLKSGEQGDVEVGGVPRKTAVIDAVNIIQWCLYYPGVLDPAGLGLSAGEERELTASLAAYRAGDLLGALAKHPHARVDGSMGARLYRAAVLLSVGQVEKARAAMVSVPPTHPGRRALEEVIAAVKFQEWPRGPAPQTSSEWLAESYYQQSRSSLEPALAAARKAVELSPEFGFAWTRVAELEFSFGRTAPSLKALERGLALAPRNAQAHALRGFLRSAQNRIGAARESFDEAIALDGALGNAWLGRGLTFIRQGYADAGRHDLQTAAVLEPNRSILRSYLGKAFSQTGNDAKARNEFARAEELDPNDPTPWLYSAIQNKQENRYNAAVRDVEKSIDLNDNRRVYRSQFLLDQDRGVRGTNLAAIYLNEGMRDVSVREAVRAVDSDYSSAAAHLFLANSYDALRDPTRVLLRYETPWFSELLLANLLAPVGGGPLSQFVSQQEYSKLFEADGFGISSVSDYFSTGEFRETGSQYGTFGNLSYALDAEYQSDNGRRPNSAIQRLETYATFKLQISPQDTVFFQTKFEDLHTGDVLQRYDATGRGQSAADRTLDFREKQTPALLLLGLHHEWSPGIHTLLLFGRLANEQALTADSTSQTIATRDSTGRVSADSLAKGGGSVTYGDVLGALERNAAGRGSVRSFGGLPFDFSYHPKFETFTGELNQIVTAGPMTFIVGGRYQSGEFHTKDELLHSRDVTGLRPRGTSPRAQLRVTAAGATVQIPKSVSRTQLSLNRESLSEFFGEPPASDDVTVDFHRLSLYAYDIWRLAPWLSFTAGVGFDQIEYPENFRSPPVDDRTTEFDRVSPKLGFILTPLRGTTIRGAYTESIGGASFDESIRLEPTQIAGFNQSYRTLISESVAGSVAAPIYKSYGLSLEQKLRSSTYLGVELNRVEQDVDRVVGAFDYFPANESNGFPDAIVPSSLREKLSYSEESATATINQLAGDCWALGARYRYTRSHLHDEFPGLTRAVFSRTETTTESRLHELSLYALYNHPSGIFARAEANWFSQENDVPPNPAQPKIDPMPGDDFWQFNVLAGVRFHRNQCELSCGLLNITGEDYHLSPLNPYVELPRDRTVVVHCKISF